MRFINYLLIAVLLVGCTSVFGQKEITEETKEWIRRAEQGDFGAQYSLGYMYYRGEGVPQGYQEAMKWFRKAAEQGFQHAQVYLGLMYYYGGGVPQDHQLAVKWYKLAAEQGVSMSMPQLEGVPWRIRSR